MKIAILITLLLTASVCLVETAICDEPNTRTIYRQLEGANFTYYQDYTSQPINRPSVSYCQIKHTKSHDVPSDTVCSGTIRPSNVFNMESGCSEGCPPVFHIKMNDINRTVHNGTYEMYFNTQQIGCFNMDVYRLSDLSLAVASVGEGNVHLTLESWTNSPKVWTLPEHQQSIEINLTLADSSPDYISLYLERIPGDTSVSNESLECRGGWSSRVCTAEIGLRGYTQITVLVDFGIVGLPANYERVAVLIVKNSHVQGDKKFIVTVVLCVMIPLAVGLVGLAVGIYCYKKKCKRNIPRNIEEAAPLQGDQNALGQLGTTGTEAAATTGSTRTEAAATTGSTRTEAAATTGSPGTETSMESKADSTCDAVQPPRQYFDFLILAQQNEKYAVSLLEEIQKSKLLTDANNGLPCKVDFIEDASGDFAGKFDLVDKALPRTAAVLAVITSEYCCAEDRIIAEKYHMALTERLSAQEDAGLLLIPVFVPERVSDSDFRKLPGYIRDVRSEIFSPTEPVNFLRRMSAFIIKSPFQNRKKTVIRGLEERLAPSNT